MEEETELKATAGEASNTQAYVALTDALRTELDQTRDYCLVIFPVLDHYFLEDCGLVCRGLRKSSPCITQNLQPQYLNLSKHQS